MSRTRTILLLANRIPYPLHDGGALAMDAMVRGYHTAGWTVHLLAMHTSRHRVPQEKLLTLYKGIANVHTVDVDNAVTMPRLMRNLLFSSEPEHVSRFRNTSFADKLEELLQAIMPDAVQLESPFLGSYIPLIRKKVPIAKLVYRMHNVEGQIWGRLAEASVGLRRSYLRSLATRMARYEHGLWAAADLLLPITEKDAAVVREAGIATPLQTVPFAITLPDDAQSWVAGPMKLYHIGAMDWLPNVEAMRWFLKEVWPELYKAAPELSFHFAGRAMPPSFFDALPHGAYCEGEVPDAAEFARDKHVLVVPLRSGGGLRIKIIEAMALGKLVISSDVGMQGIEAVPGQHYLAANTASEFILQAVWAGAHREEAAAIAVGARSFVREHYDAGRVMRNVSGALEALIGASAE